MVRIMTKMIGLLCLLTVFLVPQVASAPRLTPTDIVRWAGCQVLVVEDPASSVISSFFGFNIFTGEPALVIGTRLEPGIPDSGGLIILFHEIGHCLQWQEGVLLKIGDGSYHDSELDADRRAADLACDYHLDGRRLLHDLFVWANEQYGYEGDWAHGTLVERIQQGELATHCDHIQQAA